MAVVLARIDDRLIHGQVTVGWSRQLNPDRLLLANNAIAADPWQSRVYASSVPPEISVSVLSIAETVAFLADPDQVEQRVLLLTGSPGEMAELVRIGMAVDRINVGGMHFGAGKLEMLPFVYVDQQDLLALGRLLTMGTTLSAQQVPGGREYLLGADQISDMEARF